MNSLLQIAMHLNKHGYIGFSLCEGESIEQIIKEIEETYGIKSKVVERTNLLPGILLVNVELWED